MADLTSYNVPGQPALNPSPIEDAFKVLAGYVGGQKEVRQAQIKTTNELLNTMVQSGMVDVDLSGGVSAPKYSVIPQTERPAYIKDMAAASSSRASEAYYNSMNYTGANGITGQLPNSIARAKAEFTRRLTGASRADQQKWKNAMLDPRQRQAWKDKVTKSFGVEATTLDSWINEALSNG